jgi:hypothetical protein
MGQLFGKSIEAFSRMISATRKSTS